MAAAAPAAASSRRHHPVGPPTSQGKQAVAVGSGGAVASADLDASRAGIDVLRHGGNAIDAAVATASTLGVTEPFVAGPGGGGYFVVYLAHQHRVVTIDGRETCPAGCRPDMFIDPATGQPLPFEQARRSGLSVGVPGMVRTWSDAVRAYGRRSFAADLRPAIGVARNGFVIDSNFNQQEQAALADLRTFSSSRQLFLTPDGQPLPVGSRLRNPDLARTYAELARHGAGYLYDGPLATAIAQTVQHPPVVPGSADFPIRSGTMTRADLAAYRTVRRAPTHVRYRGLDVYGMAPSSSGGTTVGEALNILQNFRLSPADKANALFHYLEASRLAFADRNAYIGDPAYVDVPKGLLDPAYARTRACLIGDTALTSPVPAGDPVPPYAGCPSSNARPAGDHEGRETNHLVVADRWGNVVSYTNTIEQIAGSGMLLPHRGFLLNNELTDFNFPTGTANSVAPTKRPRSSMSPTIVYGPDGHVRLAVGAAGGATIIAQVAKAIIGVIDFHLTAQQAIALPTVFAPGSDTIYLERGTFLEAMAPQLQALGHAKIDYRPPTTFKGNAVEWVNGHWAGAADPRSEGAAVAE
jgi:gamma-glutamyltranspeptidase/glutathione hydrolase